MECSGQEELRQWIRSKGRAVTGSLVCSSLGRNRLVATPIGLAVGRLIAPPTRQMVERELRQAEKLLRPNSLHTSDPTARVLEYDVSGQAWSVGGGDTTPKLTLKKNKRGVRAGQLFLWW